MTRLVELQDDEAELLSTSIRCLACGHLDAFHSGDDIGTWCFCGCIHDPTEPIGPNIPYEPTPLEQLLLDTLLDNVRHGAATARTIAGHISVSKDLLEG